MSMKYSIPYNKVSMEINPIDQELMIETSATEQKSITLDSEKQNDRYFEIPKLLDGYRLLNSAHAEDPDYVYAVDISRQDLKFVLEDDLKMFTRLETLKAGENTLSFSKLGAIPSLRKLIMPCNDVVFLDLEFEGRFDYLEHLDLSYNSLDISALAVLASLPSLKYLDVTRNEISRFPSVIRTMHKWKDFVIERLIPTQVAEMEASLAAPETKKENTTLLSRDVQPSRRSFKSTVSMSRSKSRLSLTDDQKEEIKRSDSRISSVAKRLSFGFAPKMGFPELQTLILEGNNISSSDIFDILGSLPNLINLNMNHNMIMALNALIPNNYNGAADVLNDNPKNITKYHGFFKLEELSLKFNRIPQLDNLVGLLCLPKIRNVYLEGNSVLKYCCNSKTKAKEDDPFYIFPSLYKINIVDLPNGGYSEMNQKAQYAVAATKYGMAVVKKPRRKEVPHFIGQILRKAAVRGPHLVAPHKVDQKKPDLADIALRSIRRSYSFTEEDIENIIRMGQIPKIRDLRVFGETRMQMEKEFEDPIKIGAKDMLYDPEKQDSTFITSVHIEEHEDSEQESQTELKEDSSEGDDDSEGEREFLSHYPLPLNMQTAVKSLRHAILNPTSYWRVLEDSYIRPTAASLKKKVNLPVKTDFSQLKPHEVSQQGIYCSFDEIGVSKPLLEENQNQDSRSSKCPANTGVTPKSLADDESENIRVYGNNFDPSSFQNAVSKAIGEGSDPVPYQAARVEITRIKNIPKKPATFQKHGELSQLHSMMEGVNDKLKKIELDLSSVLRHSKLQKKLPQSKQLLKEIKEEYSKLQEDLLFEAKIKFKEDVKNGFANVDDATESELQINTY